MEETRICTGGMDLESAPEFVQEGDYRKAFNVRNKTTTGEDLGRLSFWNDFELKDNTTMPAGTNKTLKSVVSEVDDIAYSLVYNDQNFHTIIEHSAGSSEILFTEKIDSGGDVLPFQADTFVNDLILHLNRWLIFTTGTDEVRMIDVQKLKQGYGRMITLEDVTLAKAPPHKSPSVQYVDSLVLPSNNLLNRIFKFKYKYIYEGGFESAWSPASVEVLPNNLNEITNGFTSKKQNLMYVGIPLQNVAVEKIQVAATANGGEWVSVREILVTNIKTLPATRVNDMTEIYTGGIWYMSFYNPFSFNLITADDADHNYDAIPLSANSLDILNSNVLVLAGLKQGYERLNNLNVSLTPQLFSQGNYSSIVGRGTLKVSRININQIWGSPYYKEYIYIQLEGVPDVGDSIKVITNYGVNGMLNTGGTIGNAETAEVFEYIVSETDTNLTFLYGNMARILPGGQVFTDSNGEYVGFQYPDAGNVEGFRNFKTLDRVDIDLNNIGYVDIATKRTFKRGSTLQFALSYKDRFGRYFPLETTDSMKITFPFPTSSSSRFSGYRTLWSINHQPPQGAVSYQWMVSTDMKHQKYVELLGDFSKDLSREGKYIIFDLNSLNRYVTKGIPGVSYSYTPGDRAYIISYWTPRSGSEVVFDQTLDLSVVSMDISAVTTVENRYLLKVEFNQSLWDILNVLLVPSEGEVGVKIQVYTPTVTDPTLDTTLYREIGPSYSITNNTHSQTSGVLEGIDDFVRGRVFEAFKETQAFGFMVEDRNITDDVASLASYRGNFRSYNDQIPGKDFSGSMRYSDVSNLNTVYRGINRFFEGRIYGEGPGETTAKHGAITKIKVVGNYLKVLQENEVAVVPVYISMVQDNSGNVQTADSDRIFNTARYIGEGKVGTGSHAKSFAISQRGTIFFFDNDRKIPYMLNQATLTNISAKMRPHFNVNVVDTLLGGYLQNYNEYWLTYKDTELGDLTLVFDESVSRWYTFLNQVPEESFNLNSEFFTHKGGVPYKLSKTSTGNNFYGQTYKSSVNILFPAPFVRSFQSVGVHADSQPETSEDGIKTSLNHTSDLVVKDFKLKEGIWYANFLRDKATGLFNGHILKGKWISLNLRFSPDTDKLNLFKVVVKSKVSTINE